MTTTYALTGKFRDHARNPIPGTRLTATVNTNLGSLALNDLGDSAVGLPRATRLKVGEDGSFSVALTATNATGISVLDGTLRYIVNVAYSDEHGNDLFWDSGYFALTANTDLSTVAGTDTVIEVSAATAMVSTLVQQAVQDHTPGIDLGTVLRATPATSTTTVATDAAGDLTGLSVTVVGQGRPVDVRFHAAGVYHSVANTLVSVLLMCNGDVVGTNNQIGTENSPLTNNGPSMSIIRRTGILTAGTNYTFSVRLWGNAAGTSTLVAASFCPIELAVTSR